MSEPTLEIVGLSYRYPGAHGGPAASDASGQGSDASKSTSALADVHLTIEPEEFVLLAGGSGSGKSTLMRTACGLVPHFHGGEITGEITVSGLSSSERGPAELARVVGYVAQEPETQVVSTTVAAELELPLELRGVPRDRRRRAIEEVALALGISELLARTTDNLSGGELQRVAIGAALVSRPPLLLLDEPTSQLDPLAADELISLLRRLNEEWGVAVLVGEHRLERFLPAADRVVAMDGGAVVWDGAAGEFGAACVASMPELTPPVARAFELAGREPVPSTVKAARALLRGEGGREPDLCGTHDDHAGRRTVLQLDGVSLAHGGAADTIVSDLDLRIGAGERVALMGASGVGKSTVLRACAGLIRPVAGALAAHDGVALLGQRPDDYFVRERVGEELPGAAGREALRAVGLDVSAGADPRDLSGGQRQRLALAIAMAGRGAGGSPPGLVCLDEPTRGLDPARKRELAAWLGGLASAGAGLLVATHDVEFAADLADRVVLMARGRIVADGPAAEVLGEGWYFATESARLTDGRAITPDLAGGLIAPIAAARTPEVFR